MLKMTLRPNSREIATRLRGAFNRAKKGAFQKAGEHWHRAFRKRHFHPMAYREYGYTPRKGDELPFGTKQFWRSYTGRKLRKMRHRLPLVWSGETRRLSRMRDVRATSKGGRVTIRARKLNLRPRGGRINMAAEMKAVSEREQAELLKVFGRKLNATLRREKI